FRYIEIVRVVNRAAAGARPEHLTRLQELQGGSQHKGPAYRLTHRDSVLVHCYRPHTAPRSRRILSVISNVSCRAWAVDLIDLKTVDAQPKRRERHGEIAHNRFSPRQLRLRVTGFG